MEANLANNDEQKNSNPDQESILDHSIVLYP